MATLLSNLDTPIFDDAGIIAPGAKVYFYAPGTTTPKDTFSDPNYATPHTNPIIADASGRLGAVYLVGAYKIVANTSADALIWSRDNVAGDGGPLGQGVSVGAYGTITGVGADAAAAFQAANDDVAAKGGGIIYLPAETMVIDTTINVSRTVRWVGVGQASIVQAASTLTTPVFKAAEDLYSTSPLAVGYFEIFRDFKIDLTQNAHNIDAIYSGYHWNLMRVQGVAFQGNTGTSVLQRGFYAKNSDPDNGANFLYNNIFVDCDFRNLRGSAALTFEGSGGGGRRANNILILNCRFTGYHKGVRIVGIGNTIQSSILNRPDNPVYDDNEGGEDFRIEFQDGYGNRVVNCWFEQGYGQISIQATGYVTGLAALVEVVGTSIGIGDGLDAPDSGIADAGIEIYDRADYSDSFTVVLADDFVAGTYVSATRVNIIGLQKAGIFAAGRAVHIDNGADGFATDTVASVIYNGNTEITLTTGNATANFESIRRITDETAQYVEGTTVEVDNGTDGKSTAIVGADATLVNYETVVAFTAAVATTNCVAIRKVNKSTYATTTTFTVPGDATLSFGIGNICWMFSTSTGWKVTHVASRVHTARAGATPGFTTVTVDDAILDADLDEARPGLGYPRSPVDDTNQIYRPRMYFGAGTYSRKGDFNQHVPLDADAFKFKSVEGATFASIVDSGIRFGADTAAANTLDDYEEGTWTPVLRCATTDFDAITPDTAYIQSKYTKIGNTVHVQCRYRTDAVTIGSAAGGVELAGLPFTADGQGASASIAYVNAWAIGHPVGGHAFGDRFILYEQATAGGTYTALLPADVATGTNDNSIIISATYTTA